MESEGTCKPQLLFARQYDIVGYGDVSGFLYLSYPGGMRTVLVETSAASSTSVYAHVARARAE